MFLPDGLKKLKRLFGAESSEGLQEQLASLRLAVEKAEETIRSLRAELQAVKESSASRSRNSPLKRSHARPRKRRLQTKEAPVRP